jgi:hypothetical protein
VHDGIEMEKLGIPTASIVTHVFINTANAMTKMMGVPGFDYVVAQHPLSSLTDSEVKARAEELAPEVERILLGSNAAK